MANLIMQTISSWVSAFVSCFVDIFEGLVPIFITTGETGTQTLTLVGTLSLAGIGIGLVYFAYSVIRNLVHLRG